LNKTAYSSRAIQDVVVVSLGNEIIPGSQETEVSVKERRRRFSVEDKRRIVEAAAACKEQGELTALLRKEGVYWSYLRRWRDEYKRDGIAARKRGPKPMTATQKADRTRVHELEKELKRMQARAERAEALVDVQKKLAALLSSAVETGEVPPCKS
jgi:transposase-like protein